MSEGLAIAFVCAFGIAILFVIRAMMQAVEERLFCGECGRFDDNLTDDDVCWTCAARLAQPQPESSK